MKKTISCCEELYSKQLPLWMRQGHSSCKQAAVCSSSRMSLTSVALVKTCIIKRPNNEVSHTVHEVSGGRQAISDIRLKTDIHRIGTTVLGLPLYRFQYRNQIGAYVGVMAQDVLKVEPSAVSIGANGYYMVDYGKLGIAMERIQ